MQQLRNKRRELERRYAMSQVNKGGISMKVWHSILGVASLATGFSLICQIFDIPWLDKNLIPQTTRDVSVHAIANQWEKGCLMQAA